MIPTRRLVILAGVPVLLAVAAIGSNAALIPLLVLDAVLVTVALVDLAVTVGEIEARRTVKPVQAVGRAFDVAVTLVNPSGRTLDLRAVDDAPGVVESGLPITGRLAAGTEQESIYRARIDARGPHPFGPVTVRWRSPLGLWERQKRLHPETEPLRVYPDFAQLRNYELETRLHQQQAPARVRRRPGGENEFERLRPYVAGDPYRHIDWKATARKQKFITRQYGQESNQNVIFLLDAGRMMTAESGGLTAFDHALNATLMMSHVALRHGDRVGLLVFDQQVRAWLPPQGGSRSGTRLIRGTYDLFPSLAEPDYALAFRHLGQRVRRRSLVVLLTSVVDEVNAELAKALVGGLGHRHLAMAVWMRDTDLDTMLERPAETEAEVWERCAAAELVGWRDRALNQLRKRGAMVVDTPPNKLTPALLSRYLEIKARRLL